MPSPPQFRALVIPTIAKVCSRLSHGWGKWLSCYCLSDREVNGLIAISWMNLILNISDGALWLVLLPHIVSRLDFQKTLFLLVDAVVIANTFVLLFNFRFPSYMK